jgi:hypothetical protein
MDKRFIGHTDNRAKQIAVMSHSGRSMSYEIGEPQDLMQPLKALSDIRIIRSLP